MVLCDVLSGEEVGSNHPPPTQAQTLSMEIIISLGGAILHIYFWSDCKKGSKKKGQGKLLGEILT